MNPHTPTPAEPGASPRPFSHFGSDWLTALLRDAAAELRHRKVLETAMVEIARTDATLVEDIRAATLWVDAP